MSVSSQRRIRVTVPATSANLGPGFDCLGVALALHNHVTMTADGMEANASGYEAGAVRVSVAGVDAAKIPLDRSNLVVETAERLFSAVGRWPVGLAVAQENHIPVGSGLGSSSAAVVAGLLGANTLIEGGLSTREILRMATAIEGHPDNVSPAILGGLVLGIMAHPNGHEELIVDRIPMPPMTVVVVLPDVTLLTSEARALLPAAITRRDAVHNISRVGLLVHALGSGDYARLAIAMEDRLHQPYRLPVIPGAEEAMAAARAAGASGVALSGAGPSLIAFAPQGHDHIGRAMSKAFSAAGVTSRTWVLPVESVGAQVATLAA
jgi:homoserine kinase